MKPDSPIVALEVEVKHQLAAFGIPVPRGVLVQDARSAARESKDLTFPVVLKAMSRRILHKSDVGAVAVGIRTPAELEGAVRRMAREIGEKMIDPGIEGFLIEEMAPAGLEMIVGSTIDPVFGCILAVGVGGIFAELYGDVTFRQCPVERTDIEEMLQELRVAPVFAGYRRIDPDTESFIDLVMNLAGAAGFIASREEPMEIDLNPVIIGRKGSVVVDAKAAIRR